MPVSRTLAVGIGEVCKTPSILPNFQAGASVLAGYVVPAWSAPWHIAPHVSIPQLGGRPQCTAARQYPRLSSLLDDCVAWGSNGQSSSLEPAEVTQLTSSDAPAGSVADSASAPAVDAEPETRGPAPELLVSPAHQEAPAAGELEEAPDQLPGAAAPCAVPGGGEAPTPQGWQAHGWQPKAEGWPACSPALLDHSALGHALQPAAQDPAGVVGGLVRAYEARARKLEQSCVEARAESARVQASVEAVSAQRDRILELNLRLGREVQQLRRERAAAAGRAEQLEDEAQKLRRELATAARELRAAQREAVQVAKRRLRTPQEGSAASPTCCSEFLSIAPAQEPRACAHDAAWDQKLGLADLAPPPGLHVSPEADRGSWPAVAAGWGDAESCAGGRPCSCGGACAWGCSRRSSYSRALMLAHKELGIAIAKGPPGLPLEPGTLAAALGAGDIGIRLAPWRQLCAA